MDTYLITGSTGLIGSALVKRLSTDNKVICPIRNFDKVKRIYNSCDLTNVEFIETDVERFLKNWEKSVDYIIHCASPTASKYFVEHPVETMTFSIATTLNILEYASRHTVKGIVYLSSLESYGTVLDDSILIEETYQGYVNPMSVRSSYNMAKRTCESFCHSYFSEYNVPVKVVRLTQTIPAEILDKDMRVYAQFARSAALGNDIELHTDGTSARQYVFIDDAVDAILTILYNGCSGEAYNVANKNTYISAKEMAIFVQRHFNSGGKVLFKKKEDMGYAPTTKIQLDTSKLEALGWIPKISLYEMYNRLINNLKIKNI